MRIKKSKTTYNNKKLASKIRRYVVKHIQNLNQVLVNLKRAKIIIFEAKPQFSQVGIKIVEYIDDINSCHPDIFKVLKIWD